MSQGREMRPSRPSLEGTDASREAGSDERQKADLQLRKLIEQGLRDMAKSAETVRDVMLSAQPSQESPREQLLIEYKERVAAIQALAQGVSDLQTLMNMPGNGPDLHASDSHLLSLDEGKRTRSEQGVEIASKEPNEEEDDILPNLKLGREEQDNSKPQHLSLPTPQPNNTPPATVPLHLIPLLPTRSSPSSRRRISIDPFLGTKNDEDAIDLQWPLNLSNATGKADSPSQQIDPWHSQNRVTGSPGISRTLAYAMGCTQPAGSADLPIPDGVGVGRDEDIEIRRDDNGTERAHRLSVETIRSGIGSGQVDNSARQHTNGEASDEKGGIVEERLHLETKSPRKVTFLDGESGRVRDDLGEIKIFENDISKSQGQEGTVADPPEGQTLAQPHLERRYIDVMEREMDIHRAKQEVEMLEEILLAREKDLCDRLETVRQRLQVIRQRKVLLDRPLGEDNRDIQQKLVDTLRPRERAVETGEPRPATLDEELERARVELEAGEAQ